MLEILSGARGPARGAHGSANENNDGKYGAHVIWKDDVSTERQYVCAKGTRVRNKANLELALCRPFQPKALDLMRHIVKRRCSNLLLYWITSVAKTPRPDKRCSFLSTLYHHKILIHFQSKILPTKKKSKTKTD